MIRVDTNVNCFYEISFDDTIIILPKKPAGPSVTAEIPAG